MNLQLLGIMVTVGIFFGGITVGFIKYLLRQNIKHYEEKFNAQDIKARELQEQIVDIVRNQHEFQTKLLEMVKNIEIQLSTMKAGEDRWARKDNCVENNRRIEDRLSIQTSAIREEIYLELDILEKRIMAQLEKLEAHLQKHIDKN